MKVSSCKKNTESWRPNFNYFWTFVTRDSEFLPDSKCSRNPIHILAEKVETMGVLDFGPGLPLADKCL